MYTGQVTFDIGPGVLVPTCCLEKKTIHSNAQPHKEQGPGLEKKGKRTPGIEKKLPRPKEDSIGRKPKPQYHDPPTTAAQDSSEARGF